MLWGTDHKLIVGKYSSIGPDVSILIGGNHRNDWITTSQLPAETFQAYDKFPKAKNVKNFIKDIPLNRLGSPEDVSELVAFLAGDESQYITGQTISIDGGLFMH